jgi:hypothetical protein
LFVMLHTSGARSACRIQHQGRGPRPDRLWHGHW